MEHVEHVGHVEHVEQVEHVEKFSHIGNADLHRRLSDLAKNVLYRFAPIVFGKLREIGFGGADVTEHEELILCAPGWQSAKDHLAAAFRKR